MTNNLNEFDTMWICEQVTDIIKELIKVGQITRDEGISDEFNKIYDTIAKKVAQNKEH